MKVAEKLASELLYSGKKLALQEKYCFHCSGSLGLEVLAPLNALGLNIGSMHPLQSFSGLKASFQNIGIAIDGSSNVLKVSKMLASALGAKPFNVPATERASYHAAACICSNYLVTIVALAQELVSKWTMDKKVALEVLLPLIDGTVTNLHQVDQAALALSGPIARGDVATVKAHLKVLPADLKKTYCVLGEQTVKIARSAGTIDSKTAEQQIGRAHV